MIKKITVLSALLLLLQSFNCFAPFNLNKNKKHSICIVVPAYNEEDRIVKTLEAYVKYFKKVPYITLNLLIVCNNCSDNTVPLCKKQAKKHKEITVLNFIPGGKGFAVKEGFKAALENKDYELIGFVDADMATKPQYFHDLIIEMDNHDGAIASRYCKGANIAGGRPFLRKLAGKTFNWIIQKRFLFSFKDTQCGAKIFTYDTIKKITPDMAENKWYFDIEMLYLCVLNHKDIVEVPTTWVDQPGSHLTINKSLIKEFVFGQGRVLERHAQKAKKYKQEKRQQKKEIKKAKKAAAKAKRAQIRSDKKMKRLEARAKKAKAKALKNLLKNQKEDLSISIA